jgi:predicted RNA-binding protein with PIN domain
VVSEFSSSDQPRVDVTVVDVMVVDGANVVGSRPDGWWNDRPGAAARLHARLLRTPELAERIVLVLEGRARAGVAVGTTGNLQVVHAPGEGDDTIVEEVARAGKQSASVAVVTADRGLAGRIEELGARRLRPGWLLDQLDRGDDTPEVSAE